jgi:hypothetical protein
MATYVDPDTGVTYEAPDSAPQPEQAQTRSQRQQEADMLRILNRIAGPAPTAPQTDPLLAISMRNTRDPWRLRTLQAQARQENEAQGGYQSELDRRGKILDSIQRDRQLGRSQTFAESQANSAAAKQDLAERKFEASQPNPDTVRLVKAAQEAEAQKKMGVSPLETPDVLSIISEMRQGGRITPETQPLNALDQVQVEIANRVAQTQAAREAAGASAAPKPKFETLVRSLQQSNIPIGNQLAERLNVGGFKGRTRAGMEKIFGKSEQDQRLDALLQALNAEGATGMFDISSKSPPLPTNAQLINRLFGR